MIKNIKTYPIADRLALAALLKKKIKGIATNEFREPKKGEWYLSGAPVECYQAPNDLTMKFRIAKLVVVTTRVEETIAELDVETAKRFSL
jgi:hypothetical protein